MGCDSHPCIEVRGRNGRWGLYDEKFHYYDDLKRAKLDWSELYGMRPSFINALGNRNYTMFAVLADVRNYDGAVRPLFAERGVPSDVSKATMKQIPLASDYHSHTYFTLDDLLTTDWDGRAGNFEVCIYATDYMAWKETGAAPADAEECPYNNDVTTREVSEEEMLMLLLSHTPRALTKLKVNPYEATRRKEEIKKGKKFETPLPKYRSGPFIRVRAPLTYRQLVPQLIECIPDLQKLGPPDRVRVVIAFDN